MMSGLKIVDLRDQLRWNPRRPRWPRQRPLDSIDKVILHQELGNGDARAVNEYHRCYDPRGISYGRNWPRIAYHYVIEKDGTIEQVNDLTDVTWHCRGQNTHSIGIMLVGNFAGPGHNGSEPTAAQGRAFFALAEHLMETLGLGPDAFFGHCDFRKPACPGTTAYSWVQRLQNKNKNEIA